tara:strand:+ start:4443 stop:4748 length:306 start_codon:yes stop_codon:yes gene_type:complete
MKKNKDISKDTESPYKSIVTAFNEHVQMLTNMEDELKPNEMEFIDEITTQITEERFGEEMYESKDSTDACFGLREEAQDFYNERYDEIENLYINLIKKYNE